MVDPTTEPASVALLDDGGRADERPDRVPGEVRQSAAAERTAAHDQNRRRFVRASAAGTGAAAVPYLFVLWSLWGPINPLRQTSYENNFYEIQTRAMFHGHLYVPNGSIGVEAFLHNGHQYTYFGLFPSILRMPILLVTSSLDGKLTSPFMLAAWLLTALFASMLIWRVRVLVRGDAIVSRAEAVSMGVLMATIMGGSVLLYLAASPYVFSEDLAWSVCLTVGSLFALLGVVERPSWGRVGAAGALVLCANLDRATTGWACAVAAMLVGLWFATGRGGREARRWWLPVLLVGLVPFLVSIGVDEAKFGIPFGVPSAQQVYTKVNAYRRQFLAHNHNSEVGLSFLPSDVVAYFQPFGLRIGSVFPYITLPATPAHALGGVLFDKRYRTDSLPPSTPLLFLLSCWGLIVAFRPRPPGRTAATRILLLAAGGAGAALFVWGYIAPRYLADYMPLLILAGAVGMVDLWRRLEGRSRRARLGFSAAVALLGLYSVAANFGVSVTPNEEWTTTQAINFVQTAQSFSSVTGNPLRASVRQGSTLPPYGPGEQVFVVGDCRGLYVSNGEDYSTVPLQQFQRYTWLTVQRGAAIQHSFSVAVRRPGPRQSPSTLLVSLGGQAHVVMTAEPAVAPGMVRVSFGLYGDGRPQSGDATDVVSGTTHQVAVITDPAKHLVAATLDNVTHLYVTVTVPQPIAAVARSQSPGSPPALVATNTTWDGTPALCRTLLPARHAG